jgi:hypothetical protein
MPFSVNIGPKTDGFWPFEKYHPRLILPSVLRRFMGTLLFEINGLDLTTRCVGVCPPMQPA